jgi:hypothetical protein
MLLLRRLTLLACAFFAFSGCTFGYGAKFSPSVRSACSARVLHVPPPPGEYEEVGFVYATGGAIAAVDAVREELAEQACALGAEAVYVPQPVYGMCTLEVFGYPNMYGVALRAKRAQVGPPLPVDGAGQPF